MKIRNLILPTLVALVIGNLVSSCDKPVEVTGEALFSYDANGFVVTFTNESDVSGDVTYLWDFGDGETSTETNPVHTYAVKGEYTVTLTVTDENGDTHPVSTKILVDRASRVSLTDGSFADWAAVTESQFISSTGGDLAGIVKSAKVEYDANFVYMYLEFEGTLEYGYWMDFMFDTDNDTLTGSRGWIWPDMGADYLVEAQLSLPDQVANAGSYYFNGETQDAWSWGDDQPFPTGFLTMGHTANLSGNAAIEVGFSRSKVPGFDGDKIKIAVFLSDPDTWADVGYAPDKAGEDGHATGTLINME
ncbi:MAG: PKD domain-containing protein [Bacteroidota bacterium]